MERRISNAANPVRRITRILCVMFHQRGPYNNMYDTSLPFCIIRHGELDRLSMTCDNSKTNISHLILANLCDFLNKTLLRDAIRSEYVNARVCA